ncbi:MAG: energy transducer TonB [Verrucomicrobiota bacterium]
MPTFEAPRPERRSMPVPVFPESVDFAEVVPGWVDLRVTIGLSGEVLEAEVLEASHPALADPARVALEQARYRVVRDPVGRPVQVTIRERIEF